MRIRPRRGASRPEDSGVQAPALIRRCRSKARPLLDQRAILGRRRAAAHVEALAAVCGGDVPVALHDPPLIALLEAEAPRFQGRRRAVGAHPRSVVDHGA